MGPVLMPLGTTTVIWLSLLMNPLVATFPCQNRMVSPGVVKPLPNSVIVSLALPAVGEKSVIKGCATAEAKLMSKHDTADKIRKRNFMFLASLARLFERRRAFTSFHS